MNLRLGVYCLLPILFFLGLGGCTVVPKEMPFSEHNPTADARNGALMLMTLLFKNDISPNHLPHFLTLAIEKQDSSNHEYRIQIQREDKARDNSPKLGAKFLIRFQLQPGDYRILGFHGTTHKLTVRGEFFMPLHADFKVPANGNYYLGEVIGVNREARDGEFRSGSLYPMIRQRITGFAQGTFDVMVNNQMAEDIKTFKTRFPQLRDREIEQRLLPAPDRQLALEYWKRH